MCTRACTCVTAAARRHRNLDHAHGKRAPLRGISFLRQPILGHLMRHDYQKAMTRCAERRESQNAQPLECSRWLMLASVDVQTALLTKRDRVKMTYAKPASVGVAIITTAATHVERNPSNSIALHHRINAAVISISPAMQANPMVSSSICYTISGKSAMTAQSIATRLWVHRKIEHSVELDVCIVARALFIVPLPELKTIPDNFHRILSLIG
jgi:hypothetical protein